MRVSELRNVLLDYEIFLAPNEESAMVSGRAIQCVSVECEDVHAVQHVVPDVWLLNVRQLLEQLVEVLQRLRQGIQCEFELSDRGLPEVLIVVQIVSTW